MKTASDTKSIDLTCIEAHCAEYDERPQVVVSAPGRFHLLGEHSWYFKDTTLSMAVNLPVYLMASVRDDNVVRMYFPQLKERKRCNLSSLKYRREDRWANSIKAVIAAYLETVPVTTGLNITVYSDVLPSAGFGVNTAIKVATALAYKKLFAPDTTDEELLETIEVANIEYLNVGNYQADINACLFGKKGTCLLTDHWKNTHTVIPFDFNDWAVLLTDARVQRISLWNEDSVRTTENFVLMAELKTRKHDPIFGDYFVYEENEVEIKEVLEHLSEDNRRRLNCIMKEHKLVHEAVLGLRNQNFGQFAHAVNKSHEYMRDMYTISCPEIDWLAKRVTEIDQNVDSHSGTACARITGKGFGRCLYTILKKSDVETYKNRLQEYERIFGYRPILYEIEPSDGAHFIEF